MQLLNNCWPMPGQSPAAAPSQLPHCCCSACRHMVCNISLASLSQLSCLCSSQLLGHAQPPCWQGSKRSSEVLDCASTSQQHLKHCCVINTVFLLNPKHDTMPATMKKVISCEIRTRFQFCHLTTERFKIINMKTWYRDIIQETELILSPYRKTGEGRCRWRLLESFFTDLQFFLGKMKWWASRHSSWNCCFVTFFNCILKQNKYPSKRLPSAFWKLRNQENVLNSTSKVHFCSSLSYHVQSLSFNSLLHIGLLLWKCHLVQMSPPCRPAKLLDVLLSLVPIPVNERVSPEPSHALTSPNVGW